MAYEEILQSITFPSSGDMSANQYFIVRVSTAGQVGPTSARGAAGIGPLQDNSTATAFSVKIAAYGVSKVAAGDSSAGALIAFWDALVATSAGRAVTSTGTGLHVIGRALTTLSSGVTGVISMLITQEGLSS